MTGTDTDAEAKGDDRRPAGRDQRPLSGARWTQVMRGTVAAVRGGNVPLLAGGVAFYAMLALVPALGAAVSLYGLVVSRPQVDRQIASLATAMPPEARQLVTAELQSIVSTSASGLRLSLAIGLGAALWSASSGMRWLLAALTAVYGEIETRRFLRLRSVALLLTLGAILALGVSLGALVALPAVFDRLGLAGLARLGVSVLRFPLLGVLLMAGLAVLYRFGPDRPEGGVALAKLGVLRRCGRLAHGLGRAVHLCHRGLEVRSGRHLRRSGGSGGPVAVAVAVGSFAVILGAVVDAQLAGPTNA